MSDSIDRELWVDMDFRRKPKTDIFCCFCQKDIKLKPKFYVYLSENVCTIVDPEQLDGSEIKAPIGSECVKKIPKEYIV